MIPANKKEKKKTPKQKAYEDYMPWMEDYPNSFVINSRERSFINDYFLRDKTCEDIARKNKLSTERVRQIINKGFEKIKKDIFRQEKINEAMAQFENLPDNEKYDLLTVLKRGVNYEPGKLKALLIIPIETFNLHPRTISVLLANDINNLEDLLYYNKNDLIRLRNFGLRSLRDLEHLLDNEQLIWGSLTHLKGKY